MVLWQLLSDATLAISTADAAQLPINWAALGIKYDAAPIHGNHMGKSARDAPPTVLEKQWNLNQNRYL